MLRPAVPVADGPIDGGALASPVPLPRPPTSSRAPTQGQTRSGPLPRWLVRRRALSLAALLALFTIGPVLALSTLTVASTNAALTAASNHRLTAVSELASVYVQTQLQSWASLQDSYAHRTALIAALGDGNHAQYNKPALMAVLSDARAVVPAVAFAAIVDPAGTFWGDEDPPSLQLIGQNFGYRDWYQGAISTGRPYVSAAYASVVPGAPLVISVAGPVKADGNYASAGTVVGILVLSFYLTTTQSLFSDFAHSEGAMLQVTDQRGVVVANGGKALTALVHDRSTGVAVALKGGSSIDRINVDGADDFAAYSPVAGFGWTVTARQAASAALADANRLATYVIVIAAVLLAILAAVVATFYTLLVDMQATHGALARANTGLEQKVALRTADLEASNRELEAFSYSVSHDLRAPLRAIDGFTRIVLEDEVTGLSPDSSRRLKLVLEGAGQMGTLIEDLLNFSRLGRVELKKRRASAALAVREVVAELKRENPDRRIEFLVQDLPPCWADPTLLKLVFRNLIANAVKFTGERVDARIEIGAVADAERATTGTVTYFVKDNGVGFDMAYSDKLFGVFQRLHRAEDFPGSGVGLALVRRIVERHGGKVWAESAPGEGATFWLTLEDGDAVS